MPVLPVDYFSLDRIRRAWLDAAEAEWRRVVRDDDGGVPGDRDVISGYFEACRWGFWTRGSATQPGDTYAERPDNPWCGLGLAACGRRLGDFLEPGQCIPVVLDIDLAYHVLPSTDRIRLARKWKAAGHEPARFWKRSGKLFLDVRDAVASDPEQVLVPGTIITVATRKHYGDYRDEWGGHFAMVRYYNVAKREVHTVEFNGRGTLGDGTKGEGVIHQVRPLAAIRVAYEFGLDHFEIMEREREEAA